MYSYDISSNLAVLHDCRFAGGISASGQNAGFGGNLFTRDSLRMMRDVLPLIPNFVREMLGILPQWQGVKEDPAINEFPGLLTHQVFRSIVGGRYLPDAQVEKAMYWTGLWGVPMQHSEHWGDWFAIYNSSDGPPLYIITLAEYCKMYGGAVMNDRFVHFPTGETRTVAQAAYLLAQFITDAIKKSEQSGRGYYEVPNTNPKQTSPSGVTRDGWDAYFRPEGEHGAAADYGLMAYIDNQGLAYEALLLAAQLLFPDYVEEAKQWIELAESLRQRTLTNFWMSDEEFFCAAIDGSGQIKLESTASIELLNGPFFEGLDHGPEYVHRLVQWLYSDKVLTPIGPRMLSLKHARFEGDYYAYQGSGAVWSVTDGVAAKGLGRWGLHPLRQDLGIERLGGWFNKSGGAIEACFVDRDINTPCYRPDSTDANAKAIAAVEHGPHQGWGASAAVAELTAKANGYPPLLADTWQHSLFAEIAECIETIPPASRMESTIELNLDIDRGKQLKEERIKRLGLAP